MKAAPEISGVRVAENEIIRFVPSEMKAGLLVEKAKIVRLGIEETLAAAHESRIVIEEGERADRPLGDSPECRDRRSKNESDAGGGGHQRPGAHEGLACAELEGSLTEGPFD